MEVDLEASWISISISISIDFEVDLEVLDDGKGFEAQRSMSQSEGSSLRAELGPAAMSVTGKCLRRC